VGFDMGGTSTDVSLMDRGLPLTVESEISGYPVKVPMIDIHTVGAGGGSVAALDAGGALTVGPESAGADPGPVCYGKGERVTVTDANLFLGRLVPERFLGGGMRLDAARADTAMRAMAAEAGLGPVELAEGIVRVANAGMERAIRVISVERGHDPHDFTLLSFGGAGGLHCAELARALGMPRVLCPANAGVLSALGMLLADVVKDYSRTVMLPAAEAGPGRLDALFAPLEKRAGEELAAEGFEGAAVVLERTLDMRYAGQSFELMVPQDGGDPATAFHALHERRYGYARPEGAVELVNLRLRARGVPDKPGFPEARELVREVPEAARLDTREVVFDGKGREVPVLDREALLPGNELPSPCLLTEYSTTTLVPPFARARVDARGNIVMEIES
jgi:N-methylhydantoinase A